MTDISDETLRLDIWLWRARFFKTRAQATEFVNRKGVRLTRHGQTRKTDKAATRIVPGDFVTFYRARNLQNVEILALGARRGPASEAQTLYRLASLDP